MSDDVLRQEHELLQRAVAASRRKFAASPLGAFATAMIGAMDEYEAARKAGVAREDACRGLEAVIRDVWPKPTTKFPPACGDCEGSGWRAMTCWAEQRCGRLFCVKGHPSHEHRYVVPCEGCVDGDRFRPRVQVPEDAIAAVGKTQKRRGGFSRMGR